MKHSALFLAVLAACATEPSVGSTEQAITDDVHADEGAECAAEPDEALDVIDATFGASSPEAIAAKSCWRLFDEELDRADDFLDWCLAQPPLQRPNCGQIYSDMRMMAYRNYYNCIVRRAMWWCGWRWGGHTQPWTGGGHTQPWRSGDQTQD
jgi:hypothetical protein